MINVNELLIDKVRSAEMATLDTGRIFGRLTSIEDPSLQTSAEGEELTDAVGATITTIYRAKKAKFTGTNSLFSLDLLAAQYGTEKEVATTTDKITAPFSEILEVENNKITLTHTPKSSIKYIYKMNNRDFATTYEATSTDPTGEKFVQDGKEITLPNNTEGKFYVRYEYESENGVKVDNKTTKFPESCALTIFMYFKDPCNENVKYSGAVVTYKAKLNPESVETALTSTGKHPFDFNIEQDYCDETNDTLFSVIVTAD